MKKLTTPASAPAPAPTPTPAVVDAPIETANEAPAAQSENPVDTGTEMAVPAVIAEEPAEAAPAAGAGDQAEASVEPAAEIAPAAVETPAADAPAGPTRWIKMKVGLSGPEYTLNPTDKREFPAGEAQRLVDADFAEWTDAPIAPGA